MDNLSQPFVLVSSSNDLSESRGELAYLLRESAQSIGYPVIPYLWEEKTKGGTTLNVWATAQRQIDDKIRGRVVLTVVMFGERIGMPLQGELPDEAESLMKEWGSFGLTHPWPQDPRERDSLLDRGKFPLTGTVYELLVGLRQIEGTRTLVGYVANKSISAARSVNDITFNQGKLYESKKFGYTEEGLEARKKFEEEEYFPQKKALFNLLRMLASDQQGKRAKLYTDAGQMSKRMAAASKEVLLDLLPDKAGSLPFKRGMDHFHYGDPLSLPDRYDLRQKLHDRLEGVGREGMIFLLEGPSGCGKSSILQKGLLEYLPPKLADANVVVIRVGHLFGRDEHTPFFRLWGVICEELGIPTNSRLKSILDIDKLAERAASHVERLLLESKRQLILAIDQFEEIIDLLQAEVYDRDIKGGWWQVVRFLGKLSKKDEVYLVGTLESMREEAYRALEIEKYTDLRAERENVDFPLGVFVSLFQRFRTKLDYLLAGMLLKRSIRWFRILKSVLGACRLTHRSYRF
ncbi:MAG: ATP-binding protein [Opitutales bacterium]